MALLSEDGTGVSGAESYASLTAAAAYWAARPHDPLSTTWSSATDANREGALREASAYLDSTWGPLYRGSRTAAAQGLLWPRVTRSVFDPAGYVLFADFLAAQLETDTVIIGGDGLELDALPSQVVTAAIELAARALTAPLAPDVDPAAPWIKREKVGPIETEYGGAGPAVQGGSYGFVDLLLGPVLIGVRNASWVWA